MNTNDLIIMGITILFVIIGFVIVLNIVKAKQKEKIAALEDEIYNLKAKILDQEKIIKHATNSSRGRLALEQIKKIESLEAEIKRQKKTGKRC
ncbi:MAG: hypothetical protein FAF04_01960 [Epsilonproteobacteria bacterium]|nr:hypothetical protein [Campylobacterota bacterium]